MPLTEAAEPPEPEPANNFRKFKEANAMSCVSRRCFELVTTIMNRRTRYVPEMVNQSLFKEECGHRDEPRLFTLLAAISLNHMTRNDFNKEQNKVGFFSVF